MNVEAKKLNAWRGARLRVAQNTHYSIPSRRGRDCDPWSDVSLKVLGREDVQKLTHCCYYSHLTPSWISFGGFRLPFTSKRSLFTTRLFVVPL